ncbi:hypothetical protein CKF58_03290 [Psittacicella hinzii]|uniref:Uncharacterized protein n=1 Tax=Psittacicella hinzii TaxID=2028575 RepID=A0A3A1YMB8_9GAMM|nr:hypothetical protein CKF58_03290 [Psittacicella hinzii]
MMAVVYCVVAEILPKFRLLKGFVYGYAVALGAHYVVFPIIGIPADFNIQGFISEIIGTGLWMWTIETFRSYCRAKWVGYSTAVEEQVALGLSK